MKNTLLTVSVSVCVCTGQQFIWINLFVNSKNFFISSQMFIFCWWEKNAFGKNDRKICCPQPWSSSSSSSSLILIFDGLIGLKKTVGDNRYWKFFEFLISFFHDECIQLMKKNLMPILFFQFHHFVTFRYLQYSHAWHSIWVYMKIFFLACYILTFASCVAMFGKSQESRAAISLIFYTPFWEKKCLNHEFCWQFKILVFAHNIVVMYMSRVSLCVCVFFSCFWPSLVNVRSLDRFCFHLFCLV